MAWNVRTNGGSYRTSALPDNDPEGFAAWLIDNLNHDPYFEITDVRVYEKENRTFIGKAVGDGAENFLDILDDACLTLGDVSMSLYAIVQGELRSADFEFSNDASGIYIEWYTFDDVDYGWIEEVFENADHV